jgi:hypothetical protein
MSTKSNKVGTAASREVGKSAYSAVTPRVKNFADVVPATDNHRRFDEMIDQTIYIVNIEPMFSEQYGAGFRIWAKDMPNEQDTFTVASFSQYNHDQMQALYNATHNGDKLLPNTCVKAVVRAAGKSYRLE